MQWCRWARHVTPNHSGCFYYYYLLLLLLFTQVCIWSSSLSSAMDSSFHGKGFLNEPPGVCWNLRTAMNFTKGRLPSSCASNSSLWCRDWGREKREIRSSYGQHKTGQRKQQRRKGEREICSEKKKKQGELEGATLWERGDDKSRRRRRRVCSLFLFSLCCHVSQEHQRLPSSQNEDALNPALLVSAVANSTDSWCWLRHTYAHTLFRYTYTLL